MENVQNRTQTQAQTQQRPFVKLREAAQISGLSQGYLRKRAKEGSIPVMRCGTVYYINTQGLLDQLEREAREGGQMHE